MKLCLNENKVGLTSLTSHLANFTTSRTFVCKEIKLNYHYENGEKTTTVESVSYTLADPQTLDVFKLKVMGNDPVVNPENFAKSETTAKISVPTEQTLVKPYKIEHGKVLVSIVAPYVKLADEISDDDALTGFSDLDE